MTVLPDQPYEQQATVAVRTRAAASPLVLRLGAVAIACMVAGVLVRGFHVLSFDFPLNDGGLFYAMTRDLQAGNYLLPSTTSYNGGEIPFAYPPLGFYVAGLLEDLTPLTLADVFRFLPWLATSLTVPAFYLLARSMLPSKAAAVIALFAFAVIPRSYIWLIMGGGLTRSFGFLFAILALYVVHRFCKEGRPYQIALASLLCGLTVLSHLETAWFLAFSCALMVVTYGRNRQTVTGAALIGLGTVVVAAPWWVSVLVTHGPEPFLAASGTGGTVFAGGEATRAAYLSLLRFVSTSEPLFPFLGSLGLFGALVCVVTRRFFLVAWWALIVLLEVRGFPTYTTVPVAMLAAIGITEVLLPALFRRPDPDGDASNGQRLAALTDGVVALRRPDRAAAIPLLVLAGLVVYTAAAALLRDRVLGSESQVLVSLSNETREAMEWIREDVPEGSSFLVIPETPFWEVSKTLEWFPALTGHTSVSTVQGSEWLPDDGFARARATHHHAWLCGSRSTECLEELAEARDVQFTHVYVPNNPCCVDLLQSLDQDADYELLYRGPAAAVYERVPVDASGGRLVNRGSE